MEFKYEMGETLKDVVTGFTGVVMARVEYHTGCIHYTLQSRLLTDKGEIPDQIWLDESQLVKVRRAKVKFNQENGPSGPFQNPPRF